MSNETHSPQADGTHHGIWWITSSFEQILEGYEPAYGLTNALAALLGNAFTQSFDPDPEQAERIRATIRRIVPRVCERLPIDPATAARGLSAADHLIWHKWITRDWQSLSSKERRRVDARMKILRNVAHAIALDEEIAGHAVTPEALARGTLFADNPGKAAVRMVSGYLEAGLTANDCLPQIVIGLRLIATAHLAGDLARAPHADLQAIDQLIHQVSFRLLAATDVSIGREPILHGLCAAIGLITAPMLSPDERDADRDNDTDRVDHISLLASQLDALFREKRIADRGDVFRHAYREIENQALRGDAVMH